MKIGSGWTKNSKDGSTFISFSLDRVVLELFPQLQNCNLTASFVKEADRKQENSPGWTLSISRKSEEKVKTKDAEKEILQETQQDEKEEEAADLISEEDIPY